MLPVRKSGGPGKEVPPQRARTNQIKRNGPLAAECLRKTRKPASDNMKHICLPLLGSPCQCRRAWRENTKGGIYRKACLLAQEFKRIGCCLGCLWMKRFPERWIIVLRAVYPWRNFPHAHLVGRVGDQQLFEIPTIRFT
jgi:hypothetical protein